MQSTTSGGAGLARFRSAPTTWLEALLEDDDEDALKPNNPCLSNLLVEDDDSAPQSIRNSNNFATAQPSFEATSSSMGFLRQNSSPAEFLSVGSDSDYFHTFGSPNYDYISQSSGDVPQDGKRRRGDEDAHHFSHRKFPAPVKGEQSPQFGSAMASASLLDMNMEKMLEDSVPCRVRAKRGCATHPRSIAERVRRTRISDRIRKLQELVPNMDKQTNTADMLEEAVEYVKYLQKQILELSEHQRKCTCLVKEIKEESVGKSNNINNNNNNNNFSTHQ